MRGGRRSGEELRASLAEASLAAVTGVREVPGERVIRRSGHPRITFGEFVASRNLESGVHAMDITHAVGRQEEIHPAAASIVAEILDGLLGQPVPEALGWDETRYILCATGRRQLTPEDRRHLGEFAAGFPLPA